MKWHRMRVIVYEVRGGGMSMIIFRLEIIVWLLIFYDPTSNPMSAIGVNLIII